MQIGIDSYSYHRLLGEIRPGEEDPGVRLARGSLDVLAEAAALGVAAVGLETCFMPSPCELAVAEYTAAAAGLELVLSWGHPDGLVYGTQESALEELERWIVLAPELGCRLVRLVAASPRVARPPSALELTARALAGAAETARAAGVELALENHGDLTVSEIERLLSWVGAPGLGVCLDTANALRVGDDPLRAAQRLAPLVRMVHLKDVRCDGSDPAIGPASVPLGAGDVPLDPVLEALREAGFQGPVCVELGHLGPGAVDERALVAQGVEWLQRALRRLSG